MSVHSSTFRHNLSTFQLDTSFMWVVSMTKTAQFVLRSGSV